MYKISVYIPESHLEVVKQAMFAAGAGRLGNYEHCAWQILGVGQFKPVDGAQPFVGEGGDEHREEEYLVDMLCDDSCIHSVVDAMKKAHPYEKPAYTLIALSTL